MPGICTHLTSLQLKGTQGAMVHKLLEFLPRSPHSDYLALFMMFTGFVRKLQEVLAGEGSTIREPRIQRHMAIQVGT